MKEMLVDIGSNTVKYRIFKYKDGKIEKKSDHSDAIRLIDHIENGVLSEKGLEKLIETLESYQKVAKKEDCRGIYPFATASLRRLSHPQDVISEVKKQTGLEIDLLSGEEEAHYSFLGMRLTDKKLPKSALMVDMGGGSTELHFFKNEKSLYIHSLPFGALSLKNDFQKRLFLQKEEKTALEEKIRSLIPKEAFENTVSSAVLVGGTAKAFGVLAREFLNIDCKKSMDLLEMNAVLSILTLENEVILKRTKELLPDRYQLMPCGIAALSALFSAFHIEKFYISGGGMREGYLYKIHEGKELSYED